MTIEVGIVPHTHWDREWYAPFQAFRLRLVRLLDELLPLLEHDLSYARFLLDGQTAVLDDYLEVRPEARERLARLAASGRISVGPWAVLMDEFMVSGETMVRDLQMGFARATELGGAMPVGYLPDMFGHVSQMPQLLRLAGLEHAVLWRGVPAAIAKTGFWWEAPDGSRVRAEYLYGSYSNGRDLPDDAKQLVARARGFEHELGDARLPGGGMLLMNGTDHQLPQPWLGRVVAEANDIQTDYRFTVTSLAEYLADQPTDDLPTWTGELRSGARANVLMGVASNRVDVHQACARAERAVEKLAEPLSALLLPADAYPSALLQLAWRQLVLNCAHDSSCACSHDEVVDQVLVRYAEARQIGEGLGREAVRVLGTQVAAPAGATLVVNPSAHDRGGLVQAMVPGEGPCHLVGPDGERRPAQVLRTVGGDAFTAMVEGRKVQWVLDLMRGPEMAGTRITAVERSTLPDGTLDLVFVGAQRHDPSVELEELKEELAALGEQGASMRFRVTRPPTREVLFDASPVPGFGWSVFTAAEGDGPPSGVVATAGALANEHLRVAIDGGSGTYDIETNDGLRLRGLGRLVDGGDGGDTYNWSPPADDRLVDTPTSVVVETVEHGPVRAQVRITAVYDLPTHAEGDERSCTRRADTTVPVPVRTTLELRTGEPFLRVRTEVDNRARDHRLRVHFPLPAPVRGSDAECAFGVVHRGLTAEGGPNEFGLPTFVSRRFVDAADPTPGGAGLALLHDGLLEYEVVTAANAPRGGAGAAGTVAGVPSADHTADEPVVGVELALTLLRCTGYLSRAELALRPNPAGPLDPVRGAQMPGEQVLEYAVLPHRGDWRAAHLYAEADAFLVPLERVRTTGGGSLPATGRALAVDGAVVSAVCREDRALVLRAFNPAPAPSTLRVEVADSPARGWVVDLRGRPVRGFDGATELRPHEIVTLRLPD